MTKVLLVQFAANTPVRFQPWASCSHTCACMFPDSRSTCLALQKYLLYQSFHTHCKFVLCFHWIVEGNSSDLLKIGCSFCFQTRQLETLLSRGVQVGEQLPRKYLGGGEGFTECDLKALSSCQHALKLLQQSRISTLFLGRTPKPMLSQDMVREGEMWR